MCLCEYPSVCVCSGFNKTALDGRFATDGKGVMAHVRAGTDAYDSRTLFWAMADMHTGKNVTTLRVEVDRYECPPFKSRVT